MSTRLCLGGQCTYCLRTHEQAAKQAGSSTTKTESWMDGCDWGKHDHAPAPTPAPTPLTSPPMPVPALRTTSCYSLVSQSVTASSCADDSSAPSLPRAENGQCNWGWEAVRALSDPLCRCSLEEKKKKRANQHSTVPYCTHLLWVAGWSVGAFSSPAPSNAPTHCHNTGRHPLSDPAREPSPGTLETLSARTVAQQTRAASSTCMSTPRPDLPTVS